MNQPATQSRMSFGDHLEELRSRLIKALLGVVVFFVVGLCFQSALIDLISRPHTVAMEELEVSIALDNPQRYHGPYGATRVVRDLWDTHQLAPRPEPEDEKAREAFRAKKKALEAYFASKSSVSATLVATKYPEAFLTGIKAAFILAMLLGAPWSLYQLWLFVGVGLYPHEKKWVGLFLPTSLVLFLSGAVFGYFILIPYGLRFLASLGGVPVMITLGEYFGLFITLTFALGIIFQLPLVMVTLSMIGIVTPTTFSTKRRYFILAAFILGAFLTPPDPVTQLLMAGPILVLYEVGIWAARALERAGKARAEAADEVDGE